MKARQNNLVSHWRCSWTTLYDKRLIQSVGVRSSERERDITVGRLICQSVEIVMSHPLLKSFRVSLPSAMEPEAERWWRTLFTRPAGAVWPPDSSSRDGEVIWPDPAEDWQSQIQYITICILNNTTKQRSLHSERTVCSFLYLEHRAVNRLSETPGGKQRRSGVQS